MTDLISVVMPCFNAESHLKTSIENVLSQTYENVELIIVNDGSTDRSLEILNEFNDKIIIINQENFGPGPARNRGIEKASGQYIAFLDSDDYWELHCLQALYDALAGTEAGLSYCGWQNVGGPANRCQPYIPPDYEQGNKVESFLRSAAPWPIHAALVKADILKDMGSFDEQWPTCMDYDLWLRIGTKYPIIRVEQVLAYYRHHGGGQITSTQWRQARNVLLVKDHFIANNPSVIEHISKKKLTELTDGAFLKRGYDAYWKRDLVSAHKIFRISLSRKSFGLKDLRYILPSILPEKAFIKLVGMLDGSSNSSNIERLKNFIFVQKCIPWSLSNRYSIWLERNAHFNFPRIYNLLKFARPSNIVSPLTQSPGHHFFGYYEKTPWSQSGDKVLCNEASFNDRPPNADDKLKIGFVTTSQLPGKFVEIAETASWNWQQGAMLQWFPTAADNEIIYNDFRDGRFVSIRRRIDTADEILYEKPIYAITPNGQTIFSLNFSRLFNKRPGYGYAGLKDPFADQKQPDNDGIFSLNTETGNSTLIISLKQLANTEPLSSMQDNFHWINHIQVSPKGTRIAFFHIWQTGETSWDVRFYTANIDGTDLKCILDTGDISHYDWQDETTILVWANHPNGTTHFLMCDIETGSIEIFGENSLKVDGHCSFSPDRQWVLNDTYPDQYNLRTLMLIRMADQKRIDLQNFYSPKEKWWGEIRCDLHPRWNRDGSQICIDSVHTGERQMHVIDLKGII